MPLHDWTEPAGWEGVHHLWISELLRWVKPRLPAGYRAYIGSAPVLAVGAPPEKPDVGVRAYRADEVVHGEGPAREGPSANREDCPEPDVEVAVATLDPSTSLFIERHGRLISAVELISPRNKDRRVSRASYLARYVGYLLEGVHLLLVDVHPRPLGFSFADRITEEFQLNQPTLPTPFAVSYRVGEPAATGGRILGIWRRPLTVHAALPPVPLPLTVHEAISISLEETYRRAAEDTYLP